MLVQQATNKADCKTLISLSSREKPAWEICGEDIPSTRKEQRADASYNLLLWLDLPPDSQSTSR